MPLSLPQCNSVYILYTLMSKLAYEFPSLSFHSCLHAIAVHPWSGRDHLQILSILVHFHEVAHFETNGQIMNLGWNDQN